jgi:CoA:oxalate CoA-transferase
VGSQPESDIRAPGGATGRTPLEQGAGLLAGVKVLDLSTYVSGPFAAMMLADLGADVIKVEPPGGDPNRRVGRRSGGTSVLFAATNHAKRSIVLDLKDPADATVLRGLIRWADALIDNWRPGVAERLGLDDDTLAGLNDRLVHLNITGWGTTGPWSDRPAFDTLLQAFSGIAWSESRDGDPSLVRFYVADKVAATYAVQGILAGLLHVARTGRGERIAMNMVDAMAYFNFPDLFSSRVMVDDEIVIDPGAAAVTKALMRASDGYLVVSPTSGRQIRSMCEALGHPDWVEQLKAITTFDDLAARIQALVESVTPSQPVAHWVEFFGAADVPVAPVLDLDGHLAHPQVVANRTYAEAGHPGFGDHRVTRFPARTPSDDRSGPAGTFPDLDEHADAIRALAAAHPGS